VADQERYERATRVLDEIYPAWRENGTDASKMPGPLGDFARTCVEHCYTDAWGRAEGSALDHKTRSLITMTAPATLGIDALGLIMKENGLSNDDIEHVETTLGPIAHMALGSHANPADLQEARFSLEYLLGEALLNGGIDVHTFERHEKLDDPEHKDAAAKVSHKMDKEQPFSIRAPRSWSRRRAARRSPSASTAGSGAPSTRSTWSRSEASVAHASRSCSTRRAATGWRRSASTSSPTCSS
jgi:alkylhydroperoxidase/carboxymuconolactone decarboxylase family protein YurZ